MSGCASGSAAISQTVKLLVSGGPDADAAVLNPAMRYLRVTTEGRVVLMVLGDIEPRPQGDIEVWYSALGEVIRLRDGRIVGTAGLPTDWREVRHSALPTWTEALAGPVQFRRERDEMPGYRFNIRETVSLRATQPPQQIHLAGVDADSLRWFEEGAVGAEAATLPPARYALRMKDGKTDVVYGEQCLAQDLCLAWQRWPVGKEARN